MKYAPLYKTVFWNAFTIPVDRLRSHSVSLVVKYCATWLGSRRIEIAKMIGMTPALFTRSGMWVLPPEYIRVPRTRFAYWTGMRRWPSWMKMIAAITAMAMTAIAPRAR